MPPRTRGRGGWPCATPSSPQRRGGAHSRARSAAHSGPRWASAKASGGSDPQGRDPSVPRSGSLPWRSARRSTSCPGRGRRGRELRRSGARDCPEVSSARVETLAAPVRPGSCVRARGRWEPCGERAVPTACAASRAPAVAHRSAPEKRAANQSSASWADLHPVGSHPNALAGEAKEASGAAYVPS